MHLKLLKMMIRIRSLEERIASEYSSQEMRCPTHLSIGQEAAAAGVGLALSKNDVAVSSHRGHGHYIGKGGNLKRMMAEIYGKASGCSMGRGGSMHLIDREVGFEGTTAIVGNSIPVGVGLGLALQAKRKKNVSVVFLGDGAIEEGAFYESVNFAVVRNLPVLFVCENNLYSVYSPLNVRQPKNRKIYKMVQGMGIKSIIVDGNNVEDVYEAVLKAKAEILKKKQPIFIEMPTYRWREHCGPDFDNHIGYRDEKEFLRWKKKDPIKIFSNKLLNRNKISQVQLKKIYTSIEKEIDEAFDFAKKSPFPNLALSTSTIFAK
jgi:TPP-dependent pyruvate/acetoin dehydrogenase alpha subunit